MAYCLDPAGHAQEGEVVECTKRILDEKKIAYHVVEKRRRPGRKGGLSHGGQERKRGEVCLDAHR